MKVCWHAGKAEVKDAPGPMNVKAATKTSAVCPVLMIRLRESEKIVVSVSGRPYTHVPAGSVRQFPCVNYPCRSLRWKLRFCARRLPCTARRPGCPKASSPPESHGQYSSQTAELPHEVVVQWPACSTMFRLLSCCRSVRGWILTDLFLNLVKTWWFRQLCCVRCLNIIT